MLQVAAHAASRGMELAMERLAAVSYDFPEIGQHLRSGLPQELVNVWNLLVHEPLSYYCMRP
jgi:hypothetical protein